MIVTSCTSTKSLSLSLVLQRELTLKWIVACPIFRPSRFYPSLPVDWRLERGGVAAERGRWTCSMRANKGGRDQKGTRLSSHAVMSGCGGAHFDLWRILLTYIPPSTPSKKFPMFSHSEHTSGHTAATGAIRNAMNNCYENYRDTSCRRATRISTCWHKANFSCIFHRDSHSLIVSSRALSFTLSTRARVYQSRQSLTTKYTFTWI